MGEHQLRRRPGNRVVRRRLHATNVIDLPKETETRDVPTATAHAKQFVVGVSLLIVVGALLLMLPIASESGESTHPTDAFFTAMSAASVTGLVTVDTATHWTFFGELVILVLIQLGGFGFMVGASVVLVALGRGSSLRDTLMMQDGSPTMSLREVTSLSRRIIRFMLITEAIGAILLTAHFLQHESPLNAIWHGIFHSVSAFCNAGFDLQGGFNSVIGLSGSPLVILTIGGLIQAGALSFMVLNDVWVKRKWRDLYLDSKLVLITNFLLIIAGMMFFLIVEWNTALSRMDAELRPMNALFQSVAARTAGFASVNFNDAQPATLFLWVGLMLIGGAAGSTAGGIKLATIAILFLAIVATLRGQEEPQTFGRRIAPNLIFRSLAIVALFMAMHFMLALTLAITEDVFNDAAFGFAPLMFEAMSGLATVGLSTGITPELSIPGKLVLFVAMFIGRLGPITAAYALQRRQQPARFRFPEAHVRIG
ncbi:MAG TPA: potassium transporter TrkG [Thermomicrobiales bacterium]|nr:potassium transporter TrkG [Thermomicrobiales bacterium]